MMNDRFDVDLRQHLLGTADERPAEGQVAGIERAVAGTAQRHPLAARWTLSPGRLGTFPAAALRFGVIAIALALAATAGAVLAPGSRGPSTVFEGTWTSTDPADGSVQLLVVGAGNTPEVYFEDGYASGAACVNDAVKRFTARGTGTITGTHLEATFPNGGGCGTVRVGVPGSYDYIAAGGTLVDQDGLRWSRVLVDVPSPTTDPTSAPSPDPSRAPDAGATVEPTGVVDANCIEFDRPGTYTAPAGSLALTVDVGVIDDQWRGTRDAFSLRKAACTDDGGSGTGRIYAAEVAAIVTDLCGDVTVPVGSAAEAAAAISTAVGLQVDRQAEVNISGDVGTAIRLDGKVLNLENSCPGSGQIAVADGLEPFYPDTDFTMYLVDADGPLLAIVLHDTETWSADVAAQVNDIIGSLRIEGSPS